MKVQIIEKNGKPEWAVIPYREYRRLSEAAEMAENVRDFDEAVSRDEEAVPHAMVQRLVMGERPVKVWREYRGLTQAALARAARITPAYLSQIETGAHEGSVRVLTALARTLQVDVEDLVARGTESSV